MRDTRQAKGKYLRRCYCLVDLFGAGLVIGAEDVAMVVRHDCTAEVVAEDREVAVKAGSFTDSYRPFGTHVYRIPVVSNR